MSGEAPAGRWAQDDNDRNRDYQLSGAYEQDYDQDNRSRKDYRSPANAGGNYRQDRQDGGSNNNFNYNEYDPRDSTDYHDSHQAQGRRQGPPFRGGRDYKDSRVGGGGIRGGGAGGDYTSYRGSNGDYDQDSSYPSRAKRQGYDTLDYDDGQVEEDAPDYHQDDGRDGGYRGDDYRNHDYPYERSPRPRRSSRERGYVDRDDERYYDRRSRDRSYDRNRSHSPGPNWPGRPCDTVIVDEIGKDMSDHDLNFGLNALQLPGLQEIRVRHNRASGRRIAFMEFNQTRNAVIFVESYPDLAVSIPLPQNSGQMAEQIVRISYSNMSRDERSSEWVCESCKRSNFSTRQECYRCRQPKPRPSSSGSDEYPALTGEKDACPAQKPYPIVVVTGLESSVGEEVLAKGIMKLFLDNSQESSQPTGPSGLKTTAPVGNTRGLGARPGSLRRVFLIRDRKSRASWRYGFGEFATMEDAVNAVAKFKAYPKFTISSKPVEVAFIHTGVFVPVIPPEPQIKPFIFAALHNPDIWLRYWEYRAFASEHIVSLAPIPDAPTSEKADSSSKRDKKRKAEKDGAGGTKKKTLVMAPQLQMWANKSAEIRGETANETPLGEQRQPASAATANVDINMSTSKTLDTPVPGVLPATAPDAPKAEPVWSYVDPKRMCCLLCQRKFKSMEHVRKHEMASDMHKENSKDEVKTEVARKALEAVGLEPTVVETGPQYRDRAKERRTVYNQPKKPAGPKKGGVKGGEKGGKGGGDSGGGDAALPATPPAPPKMAKGMAMLTKMGLKVGEGLGADGSGRTEIVATDMYRPGVGLGAEGAKIGGAGEEGERATKEGGEGFVSKTKDKARQRFESMK